jgi:hypothetical protein
MTTVLKHLQSYKMPSSSLMAIGLAITPSVQAIIVDCVPVINPQLASIIRNDAESVTTCTEDPYTACPPRRKMISPAKTTPIASCVRMVHYLAPACHIRPATRQFGASTTLPKIEAVFPEEPMAINGAMLHEPFTTGAHDCPSV